MLIVISPAKRLDWTAQAGPLSAPTYQEDALTLARVADGLGAEGLGKLMHLSPKLAQLNADRFASFAPAPEADQTRPAVFAFAGDTYQGLEAKTLDTDTLRYAQDHLRILSGLYGLLRPLDGIQPYRLEMGTRLKTDRGQTLYAWWGDRLAKDLRDQAAAAGARYLLNCASQEYFGAVETEALGLPIIIPRFLEQKDGTEKMVSFYAKAARGALARYVLEQRVQDPADLSGFDLGGYALDPDRSTPTAPVFTRPWPAAAAAGR